MKYDVLRYHRARSKTNAIFASVAISLKGTTLPTTAKQAFPFEGKVARSAG
ncbi:MAG: hypothetical protein IJS44_06325 [Clostridia bacterium]|nr:hypothetical protein [Clostridia bacterium]